MLYKWKRPENINRNPQSDTMTNDYYNHVKKTGSKGVLFPEGKLDYIPYTDAFKMHYNARKTDFVTSYAKSSLDWLVSPPFADFLQTFNLPEYQVFDAVVEHRHKRYSYKIIHFCFETLEVIDYSKSYWYLINLGYNTTALEKVDIQSIEQYREQQALLLPNRYITAKKLVFIDNIQTDIVRLVYPHVGLFIHERLKTAIQAAGFTGIDFAEVPNPLIQYLVWADTGLPVED